MHLAAVQILGGAADLGCERAEFTLTCRGAAVAATNDLAMGAMCNRRVTARVREFGARGRGCVKSGP